MKVIIIDDEPLAIEILGTLLNKLADIEIVGSYTNPEMAIADLKGLEIDVAFVDMEMTELHGLQVAEKIGAINPYIEIVFVTAHSQFAFEAFEVNAIDYLLKPVDQRKLTRAIDKLQKIIKGNQESRLGKKIEGILYAKVMGRFFLFDAAGNEVTWRTKKTKELFIFLWQHKDIGVSRSQIISALWSDLPEEKVVPLFHTTIHQLRRTIRGNQLTNPVVLKNERYYLDVPVDSDLAQLKSILTSTDLNQSQIGKINSLYCGDFLELEEYEWAFPEQERIKFLYLGTLENYVLNKEAKGRDDHFIESCLKRLLLLEPYNTKYVYQLLDFYGETKNMQRMISLFQIMREKWKDNLGLDIPREIVEVYSKYIKYK